MTPGEKIPERDGLLLQLAAFAGNEPASSFLEIRPLKPTGGKEWVPVRDLRRGVEAVMRLRENHEVFIGINPRTDRVGTAACVARSWCLLADCDSPEAVELLRRFQPRPSIVVASSPGHMHAYWPLRHAIDPEWARRANLRLAHALAADTACADPARVMRAIGSVHRKQQPMPVRCVRLQLDMFEITEVIAGLADARTFVRPAPAAAHTASPRRASRALAGAADAVRQAPEGNRNNALNWAAYRLGAQVARQKVAEGKVRAELHHAAADAGLGSAEIERTISSGLQAGMRA
jgi:hypothetical protein